MSKTTVWRGIFGCALGLGFWHILVTVFAIPKYIFPSPVDVAMAFVMSKESLITATAITGFESTLGLGLAALTAILVSALCEINIKFRNAVVPFLVASKSIPLIAVAPLLTIWFGFGLTAKSLTSAIIAVFPIVMTMLASIDRIPSARRELVQGLEVTKLQEIRILVIPSVTPGFFEGLKIACPLAVVGAIVSELTGATDGLGYLLTVSTHKLEIELVMACVFCSCMIGWVLFLTCVCLKRAFCSSQMI